MERAVTCLLSAFDDAERPGLVDTPRRVVRMYRELLAPVPFTFTTFPSEGYDELIIVSPIPFYSLCEHHLMPFFGHATVAYLPEKKIVGLSKLPRVVESYARSLQVQERMTKQVAQFIQQRLRPRGVAVIITARHLCVEMRGVKKPGAETTTSSLSGVFKTNTSARNELLHLHKKGGA